MYSAQTSLCLVKRRKEEGEEFTGNSIVKATRRVSQYDNFTFNFYIHKKESTIRERPVVPFAVVPSYKIALDYYRKMIWRAIRCQ